MEERNREIEELRQQLQRKVDESIVSVSVPVVEPPKVEEVVETIVSDPVEAFIPEQVEPEPSTEVNNVDQVVEEPAIVDEAVAEPIIHPTVDTNAVDIIEIPVLDENSSALLIEESRVEVAESVVEVVDSPPILDAKIVFSAANNPDLLGWNLENLEIIITGAGPNGDLAEHYSIDDIIFEIRRSIAHQV